MPGSSIKRSLGSLTTTIHESRVLLVGAGGIGCELLKNLVLTGFGEIHIIDLDTIDLSNLNRQFLFRHEHIKKSKALVAKEVAQKFKPDVKLEAYHANIMDKQFHVDWFQSFTMVFNALDNITARRHVNRMCLAAGIPLIESGTTGFNGQVQVIEKGETECYDCNPKPTTKSYPICTIRSSPTQPIHCIVWGKSYLLPYVFRISPGDSCLTFARELFGESEDQDEDKVFDTSTTSDNEEEISNLKKEKKELELIRGSMDSENFARLVFEKVFIKDIERLREMEDMWKERKPPNPLNWDHLVEQSTSLDPKTIAEIDQKDWTQPEAFVMFRDSLDRLSKRLKELQEKKPPGDPAPALEFDKDDEETLIFVTATAVLRSAIFDIKPQSKFDTKQMAGNIIPAIATTNAMTAGLCVLQAFKVLQKNLSQAKMVFLERSGARVINSDHLNPPRSECSICSAAIGRALVNPGTSTLKDIVEMVQSELGYTEEFSILKDSVLIYDPDEDAHLSKTLPELGITNGSSITVVDEDDVNQVPRVNLELHIFERSEPATGETKAVSLKEPVEIARKPKPAPPPPTEDPSSTNGDTNPAKRKREGDDDLENGHIAKKIASDSTSVDKNGTIVLDDEDVTTNGETEGTILID